MNRWLLAACCAGIACGEVVATNQDAAPSTGKADAMVPDPGNGGCSGPQIALGDMPSCLLKVQCERALRCTTGFLSQEHCEERWWDVVASLPNAEKGPTPVFFALWERAVTAQVTQYNSQLGFSCIEELRSQSCKGGTFAPSCEQVFRAKEPAAACGSDMQCANGQYCTNDKNQCDGVCRNFVDLGGACKIDVARCRPELRCVYSDTSGNAGICTDGRVDALCNRHEDCQENLYCYTKDGESRCAPDRASAAACDGTDAMCPGDEMCVNNTCTKVDVPGAPCSNTCWGNLVCNGGRCVRPPIQGDTCTNLQVCNSVDLMCEPGTYSCKERRAVGQGCASTDLCKLGLFCSSELAGSELGACTEPQPDNHPCTQSHQCESGWCDTYKTEPVCAPLVGCWE